MFIGRKEELKQLESIYGSDHSNMLVLYGREGIGKTALALNFSESRDYVYYQSVMVSDAEQEKRLDEIFSASINMPVQKAEQVNDAEHPEGTSAKKILIIDEFHYAMNSQLVGSLLKLISSEEKYGKFMILLLSSSVNWVENSMVVD